MGQASMRHADSSPENPHHLDSLTMPSGPHASSQSNCRVMERPSKPVQLVPSQGTKERRKEERKKKGEGMAKPQKVKNPKPNSSPGSETLMVLWNQEIKTSGLCHTLPEFQGLHSTSSLPQADKEHLRTSRSPAKLVLHASTS